MQVKTPVEISCTLIIYFYTVNTIFYSKEYRKTRQEGNRSTKSEVLINESV